LLGAVFAAPLLGTGAIVGPENIAYAASPANASTTTTAATLVLRVGPDPSSATRLGATVLKAAAPGRSG
jgi:hypothetical protein